MKEIANKFFHLPDIQRVPPLDSAPAGGIGHHAVTHGFRRRHILFMVCLYNIPHNPFHFSSGKIFRRSGNANHVRACLFKGNPQFLYIRPMVLQEIDVSAVHMDEIGYEDFLHRYTFRSFRQMVVTHPFMGSMLINDEKIFPMLTENETVRYLS